MGIPYLYRLFLSIDPSSKNKDRSILAAQTNRLTVLDSYRALAALYVVCFHYFYRWTDVAVGEPRIPTTPLLSHSAVIQHGYLGVVFFFIISGFVIALTLRHTNSFLDFAVKRFARLFPAMLSCASFTYVAVKIFRVEPFSDVALVDFLPSLTFMSPQIFNKLLGVDSHWISGVYWSLFIEVKFYFFAAVIYFVSPKNFLISFSVFAALLCGVFWYSTIAGYESLVNILELGFFPKYAFLFVAGMTFYEVHDRNGNSTPLLSAIIMISLTYSVLVYSPLNPVWPSTMIAMLMIVVFHVLFVLFVIDASVLAPIKSRMLAKIGAASYSLYLLHESIGVSAINRLNEHVLETTAWPFVVATLVVFLSIAFYDHIETPSRRLIRSLYATRFRTQH
jgi:peptidoglycan/LPS O-acetylase OafA/YrhL